MDQSTHAIVVEAGLRGKTLAAVLLATLTDRPPYLRINAAVTQGGRRTMIIRWAETILSDGRRAAILSADDFEEICRAAPQTTPAT